MSDWQAAQWVLAAILTLQTVWRPVLHLILSRREREAGKSRARFWGEWAGSLLARSGLVAILIWGGFF